MAGERLNQFLGHLKPASSKSKLLEQHPDDIVVTTALRTALCRGGKGGFANTPLDDILYGLLKGVIEKCNIDPKLVESMTIGNVLNNKAAYVGRAASLAAGFPNTTPVQIINRFCSSGLMAIQSIANEVKAGEIEIGLAVGAESMSFDADPSKPEFSESLMGNPESRDCAEPMGWTSENVARDFDISREDMDAFAAQSYQRAEKAQSSGASDTEIIAVKNAAGEVITKDDGIRKGTTKESLGKVRPAFPEFGPKTTGGNASQITDGAAALLLMRRSTAQRLGLKILAKYTMTSVVGIEPRIMGIAPSMAIPKVLGKLGLSTDDIDIFEINEAFASMAVYCRNKLGIPNDKMNPRGGAIAIGHPLGATGARLPVTLFSEMKQANARIGVTSMCVGSGQGAAAVWINEQ